MAAMKPHLLAWLVAAVMAALALAQLMHARQSKLVASLRSYVLAQQSWARQRAKAARMAQHAARAKPPTGPTAEPPHDPD